MTEWIIPDNFVNEETRMSADGQGYLQELVRCKDCKISKLEKVFKNVPQSKEKIRWCELIQRYVDNDWFCADGERR